MWPFSHAGLRRRSWHLQCLIQCVLTLKLSVHRANRSSLLPWAFHRFLCTLEYTDALSSLYHGRGKESEAEYSSQSPLLWGVYTVRRLCSGVAGGCVCLYMLGCFFSFLSVCAREGRGPVTEGGRVRSFCLRSGSVWKMCYQRKRWRGGAGGLALSYNEAVSSSNCGDDIVTVHMVLLPGQLVGIARESFSSQVAQTICGSASVETVSTNVFPLSFQTEKRK